MKLHKLSCIVAAIFAVSLPMSADADLISITDGIAFSAARDGSVSNEFVEVSQSFSAPFTQTAAHGGSSSTTTYDNVLLGSDQTLSWAFQHQQAGAASADFANSVASGPDFTFTALDDLIYTLSGFYDLTGQGRIRMLVKLEDQSAGGLDLFRNDQESIFTADESLVLGGLTGEKITLLGGLSGTLTQGHVYQLNYNWSISEQDDGSGPVGSVGEPTSALGAFQMTLSLIPEPTTCTLALAALCLAMSRRRAF